MNDLAHCDVHGAVETLRTGWAEWDPAKNDWKPLEQRTSVRFRPDGQISGREFFNPDGSVARTTCLYNEAGQILETTFQVNDGRISKTASSYDPSGRIVRTVVIDESGTVSESEIYSYDSSGRKTKIQFLMKVGGDIVYSVDVEGAVPLFGASGAATMTTVYDDHDRATEVLVHDASHRLLRRMTVTRDTAGRVVTEEVQAGTLPLFPEIEDKLKDAPPEDRESLKAALAAAFGPSNALLTTTYAYDQKGRRVELIVRMGLLVAHRSTFRFDDHDNPIEEISEDTGSESSHKQHDRSIYKYDAEGNWTEREVGTILEPNQDFHRSNIERRQITYYQRGSR